MNEITTIFIKVTLSAFIVVFSPLVLRYLVKQINKMQDEKLRQTVLAFVEAADQMLKKEDPTGEKRKQYVVDSLKEMGIPCNTYVNALIEQAVYGLWDME